MCTSGNRAAAVPWAWTGVRVASELHSSCGSSSGDNGLKAVLELLHLFVTEPCWTEGALYRAKQAFRSHYLSLPKSLERSTADRILTSMLGSDRCLKSSAPAFGIPILANIL